MRCTELLLLLSSLTHTLCFWTPTIHRVTSTFVDLRDERVFEILPGNDEDEENENEIIQPDESLVAKYNDDRYKPLHAYIERYNRRAIEDTTQIRLHVRSSPEEEFPFFMDVKEEQDEQPFVAGYKKDLDEFYRRTTLNLPTEKVQYEYSDMIPQIQDFKPKRSDGKNEGGPYERRARKVADLFRTNRPQPSSPATDKVTEEVSTESPQPTQTKALEIPKIRTTVEDMEDQTDEVAYDYERFKAEYDQLVQDRANDTFNYTDKGEAEKDVKDILKKLVDVKEPSNCTKEELTRIGLKAMKCLIHDYKHAKDKVSVRKLFRRTWLVLKIWICIYLCVAIPCWCHRGWCCCCCRCRFCFPRRRIAIAKKYYTLNIPGKMIKDFLKPYDDPQRQQVITYKPTEYEEDAYEEFGAALRNL